MGFAEKDWLQIMSPEIDFNRLEYLDYNDTLKKYSHILKNEHNCDFVVAINHMKLDGDLEMAAKNSAPEILDLILGGHDHIYRSVLDKKTNVYIQKSGSDYKEFSNLTILFGVESGWAEWYRVTLVEEHRADLDINYSEELQRLYINERVIIDEKFKKDEAIEKHINYYTKELNKQLDVKSAFFDIDLEARFSRVRSQETNLANFTADIIRTEYQVDFGFSNSGCLRANCIYPKGVQMLKVLSQIYPMSNGFSVIEIQGHIFKRILENSVSSWPNYDGKFPCISGAKFKFDSSRETGDRITELLDENDQPIDMDKYYTIALDNFIAQGRDGFDALLDPSVKRFPHLADLPIL